MASNGLRSQLSWEVIHKSYFFQGILQVLLAVIVSCWFPVNLENQKAKNAEQAEYYHKKEEIYTRFATSLSFTLTLNDEMRECYKVISCETDKYYEDRCKDIISKGGFSFATMQDPLDVIGSMASLYYSGIIANKIDEVNKKVVKLMDTKPVRCKENDEEYKNLYKELVGVDYPAVMSLMRQELNHSRGIK
jgi:hypothetical protein